MKCDVNDASKDDEVRIHPDKCKITAVDPSPRAMLEGLTSDARECNNQTSSAVPSVFSSQSSTFLL